MSPTRVRMTRGSMRLVQFDDRLFRHPAIGFRVEIPVDPTSDLPAIAANTKLSVESVSLYAPRAAGIPLSADLEVANVVPLSRLHRSTRCSSEGFKLAENAEWALCRISRNMQNRVGRRQLRPSAAHALFQTRSLEPNPSSCANTSIASIAFPDCCGQRQSRTVGLTEYRATSTRAQPWSSEYGAHPAKLSF